MIPCCLEMVLLLPPPPHPWHQCPLLQNNKRLQQPRTNCHRVHLINMLKSCQHPLPSFLDHHIYQCNIARVRPSSATKFLVTRKKLLRLESQVVIKQLLSRKTHRLLKRKKWNISNSNNSHYLLHHQFNPRSPVLLLAVLTYSRLLKI